MQNPDSLETLGRNLQECQKQLNLKYTLINDVKIKGEDNSILVYEIKDIEDHIKSYQMELKKTYEEIFPETKNSPLDFWDSFLSL